MSTRASSRLSAIHVSGPTAPVQTRGPRDKSLKNLDRLILAQAVFENGEAWTDIARLLNNHPQLIRPGTKSFFTPTFCQTTYKSLMNEAGIEYSSDVPYPPNAPQALALAQKHFDIRMAEVKELIAAEEAKFKILISELEEIRSGLWDDKIEAKITGITISEPLIIPTEPEPKQENITASQSASSEVIPQSPTEAAVPRPEAEPIPAEQTVAVLAEVEGRMIDSVDGGNTTADDNVDMDVDTSMETPRIVSSPLEEDETINIQPSDSVLTDIDMASDQQDAIKEEPEAIVPTEITDAVIEVDEAAPSAGVTEPKKSEESPVTIPKEETVIVVLPEEPQSKTTVDDDVSSGEEPLHMTRRTSLRRRSVSSVAQPSKPAKKLTKKQKAAAEAQAKRIADTLDRNTPIEIEMDGGRETSIMSATRGEEEVYGKAAPVTAVKTREGKRKASVIASVDSPRDRKRARDDSEPVDEDDNVGPSTRRRRPQTDKKFTTIITMLHTSIHSLRGAGLFHNPISNREAPNYHGLVKRPTDLRTIKAAVKDGAISTSLEFQRDIFLMLANAIMFNLPGTDVNELTKDIGRSAEELMEKFRQTEGIAMKK